MRAVISAGEYRLRGGYSKLAIESSKWFKTTTEQCCRKIDRFMNAASSRQYSSSDYPLDTLAIPQQFKESLWKKAEDLAEDRSSSWR